QSARILTRVMKNASIRTGAIRATSGLVVAAAAALAVIASVAAAGATAAETRARGKKPDAAAAACKRDADCVLVPVDCCPCSAGGQQRALPAKEKAAYERERQGRCADTMCTAMMSTDPSCEATKAVCKAGACALGGPPPSAGAGGAAGK